MRLAFTTSRFARYLLGLVSTGVVLTVAAAPAMAGDDRGDAGAVYTQTQDPAGNEVVVYRRAADGTISERARVATGGVGAAATPPNGFPILDSQDPIELTSDGRLLFTVNAGDDTISAFKVDRQGGLRLVDRQHSGGDLPISLDSQGRLLYVLNELSGDIAGFRFSEGGQLKRIPGSTESLSTPGAGGVAAQIGFAPRDRVLTVTLRGTQVIDTFRLQPDDSPGAAIPNPSTGENPFGFAYRADGTLVVSNAGRSGELADPTAFQGSASSYDLDATAGLQPIDTIEVGQRATCWVVITADQRYAFMTNTLSNTVSGIRIADTGELQLLAHTPTGAGFPADEALSRDSRYLYVLVPSALPGTTSHIDYYRVGPGGSLTQIGTTPSNLPLGVSGLTAR
jgi:6-phosphogluconolactonase